jgi:hypothetical protein
MLSVYYRNLRISLIFPMNPTITVNGEIGYIFAGTLPDTYCFVPDHYVAITDDGRVTVDEIQYFVSGWSVRNMRAAYSEPGGSHLFPDQNDLIRDFKSPEVEQFLSRVTSRTHHPFSMTGAG